MKNNALPILEVGQGVCRNILCGIALRLWMTPYKIKKYHGYLFL